MSTTSMLSFAIMFVLSSAGLIASEYLMNDNGYIVKVDGIDIDYAKAGIMVYDFKIDNDLRHTLNKAVNEVYKDKKGDWEVVAGKKINDCLLLVSSIKTVDDSGIFVVYSLKANKVIGLYNGPPGG